MTAVSGSPVRLATQGDLRIAAGVLAAAFENYPWTRWAIPEPDYLERLKEIQRLYLEYALAEGIVLIGGQVDGVTALLPPDASEPSSEFQNRVAALHGSRFPCVMSVSLPPKPAEYWSLETVGVRPNYQGQGLGSLLIRAGIDAVARSGGAGLALETSVDTNVRLYRREGFAVHASVEIQPSLVVNSMSMPIDARQPKAVAGDTVEFRSGLTSGGKK